MLVRARRLVFDDSLVGSSFRRCVTGLGDYSVSRLIGSVLWSAKRNGNHICEPLPTERTAIEACQSDFNARWLAETEVMPLEFVAWDDEKAVALEDGYTAYGATGEYELWLSHDDNAIVGTFRPYGAKDSEVIHYQGKTKADAMKTCNEHHRKIVLGE